MRYLSEHYDKNNEQIGSGDLIKIETEFEGRLDTQKGIVFYDDMEAAFCIQWLLGDNAFHPTKPIEYGIGKYTNNCEIVEKKDD